MEYDLSDPCKTPRYSGDVQFPFMIFWGTILRSSVRSLPAGSSETCRLESIIQESWKVLHWLQTEAGQDGVRDMVMRVYSEGRPQSISCSKVKYGQVDAHRFLSRQSHHQWFSSMIFDTVT